MFFYSLKLIGKFRILANVGPSFNNNASKRTKNTILRFCVRFEVALLKFSKFLWIATLIDFWTFFQDNFFFVPPDTQNFKLKSPRLFQKHVWNHCVCHAAMNSNIYQSCPWKFDLDKCQLFLISRTFWSNYNKGNFWCYYTCL